MSLLDALIGAKTILSNGVEMLSRRELNFIGFNISDNTSTKRTDIAPGALTSQTYGSSATVAPGTLGRFDLGEDPATATLADGTRNGDRVAVLWVDGSSDVDVDMGNVNQAYGESLTLGSSGVRRADFVWDVPIEGVPSWHVWSTVLTGGGSSSPAHAYAGVRVISTAEHTFELSDAGKFLLFGATGEANTAIIPLNSSVAFPIGTILTIAWGGWPLTWSVASGLYIKEDDSSLQLRVAGCVSHAVKVYTNTWHIYNGLALLS